MTPRIAIFVTVLAAAAVGVTGCDGSDPSASARTSPTPPGGSPSPSAGVSVVPGVAFAVLGTLLVT